MTFSKSILLLPFLLVACKTNTMQKEMAKPYEAEDKYLWLEEVESPKALQFAKDENKKTLEHFKKNPLFKSLEADIRKILLAKDRVPGVSLKNGDLYNFWQDEKHVRGLWRKTALESYKTAQPQWDVIIDVDALAKKDGENWVWKGASTLPPHHERALVYLSRGGKDAVVVREFDMKTKQFIKGGFELPEEKSNVSWKDENTVLVGTNFGPDSMTDSGYPRIVKEWKRGTPLSEAKTKIEGVKEDMSVYGYTQFTPEGTYTFFTKRVGFYEGVDWYELPDGSRVEIPMPHDAEFNGVFKNQFLYLLRSDLGGFKQGSLVALPVDKVSLGKNAHKFLQLIFAPTDTRFLQGVSSSKNYLFLYTIDNVLSKIVKASYEGEKWKLENVELGGNGMAYVTSTEDESDTYLAQYVDFLTPFSTFVGDAADPQNKLELIKKSPERFNPQGLKITRHLATSKDGTKIPYFMVAKENIKLDGKNPTLQYGYGGFEAAMQPSYLGSIGKVWLERGGVYVLTNLRGGGEFGPAWHKAVLKENRYKVYEDNIAISEDLIARGVTSPEHLGISGRSNGGLLTGATFTQRPDLYNAVIVGVPLLDMLRYHKLLAGASWMDEYGNPDDPKMREAILKYSPYQKVNAQTKYPEVFFMTSTKDDRVHPGHARKMVAKMREQGHPLFYYENMEGGHAGNANIEQSILWNTLEYTYLWEKLK
ncbi:prolyl oligopeptidase [Bdellovibrio bacteriovorus]|uniref:Prolyl oligopeptidase n=1 Tax=Bdellovibrio bacteriovorus TaxID=959 RepID=A0A150WVM5_BDEBC|nr:prolyl oligopeptidase family serine peptidase [Bdellovibrio bacteriovorus]KYG70479.1 prolyl oligopeptidase [Bdellovibrio bacteriovorus]